MNRELTWANLNKMPEPGRMPVYVIREDNNTAMKLLRAGPQSRS